MKMTFISMGLSTDAVGIRILSSILKQQGHQAQLIFLPTLKDIHRRAIGGIYSYDSDVMEKIVVLCQESNLIGISLMSHHYTIAKVFTQQLKSRLSTPVIWGGIHPTVNPEESLETADMVCVGEGETALPELINRMSKGQDLTDIPGIWTKQNGRQINNGPAPLAQELDSLPFPDYSFEDHHLTVDDVLQPMNIQNWPAHIMKSFPPLNLNGPPKPAYQIISARGCPFHCSFCGEVPLSLKIYGRRYFRKRNIGNVIAELEWVRDSFPFIGEICFCDDTFASRSLEEIKDFTEQYKKKIRLPFYILVTPVNVVKDKFDLLVGAGLTNVGMGIQSGSSRIIEIYKREHCANAAQSLRAAQLLNSYKDRLLPYYDFIVENPYESREDLLDTVKLLVKLPRPFVTRVYALSFFPGTPLYEKASADGILFDSMYEKTFGQRTQGGYLKFIIDMNKYEVSRRILKILISKPFLKVFNQPFMDGCFLFINKSLKWLAMRLHFRQTGL